MSYRKGELTMAQVNQDYPWQIALPASVEVGRWVHLFGAAPRGHSVIHSNGEFWNVYCFRTKEQAEIFGRKIDGCWFDPKDKGSGTNWTRWTPKQKPLTFSELAAMDDVDMCNLYSHKSNRQAIIELTRAMSVDSSIGNLEPLPGIFPDYSAPIVRNFEGERQLTMARWGMPSPQFVLEGKSRDPGVTNIRNTSSPHWRRWLGVSNRCVVPFTSFSEFNKAAGGDIWFASDESRPLAFFAGIQVRGWTSTRKAKVGPETIDLFGFLTTEPNAEVKAIHPKAMPVILTDRDEIDMWLSASWEDAKHLQRPLPDGSLQIVAAGVKKDEPA